MQSFIAYSKGTGEVLFSGTSDRPELLENDLTSILLGEEKVEEGYITDSIYYPLPDKPSIHHVFDYTTKTWVDPRTPETEWPQVRAQRNQLLQQSDWTQLPDVPIATKEAWAVYRQQLRDVTDQPDPFNIVWPTAPN
jgi:hypothetical protein